MYSNSMKIITISVVLFTVTAASAKYGSSVESIGDKGNLKRNVQRFVDRFPKLKRWIDQESKTTVEVIKKITNRGFLTFSQSASMQALDSIKPAVYDGFKDAVMSMLDVPASVKPKIREGLFDLVPFLQHNEWHLFDMMFSVDTNGKTKYVCILAHNNKGLSYDFVIADMRTTFTLAPNLIVLQQKKSSGWGLKSSSKTIIKRIPAGITVHDLEVLMNFFDVGALVRFAKMLDIPMASGIIEPISDSLTVTGAVNAGVKMWNNIASAFKTKVSNEIVKEIAGDGFDKFTMNSVAHVVTGLHPSALDRYVKVFPRLYDIPGKYMEVLKELLFFVQWIDSQTWQKNDILFDINTGGMNSWVTLLTSKNPNGSYNFLICNVKQTFKLAPDVLVIKQSKSVAGGIYESEKFKFKKIPRSLKPKDLEQLIAFFNIVTFKRFAATANMKINKPDPQIKT